MVKVISADGKVKECTITCIGVPIFVIVYTLLLILKGGGCRNIDSYA